MRLVGLLFLIAIGHWGCNNQATHTNNFTSKLILDYKDPQFAYSLAFKKDNYLVLTMPGKEQKSALVDHSTSTALDSFILALKQKKSDSLYFLPHLETGGTYTINIPLDTSLHATLVYGENKPRILYDLVSWAEHIKANSFTTGK